MNTMRHKVNELQYKRSLEYWPCWLCFTYFLLQSREGKSSRSGPDLLETYGK